MMGIGILAVGESVPDRVVTNEEVARWCGATQQWILDRTGVQERRYADECTATSDLGAEALLDALRQCGVPAAELGIVTVATSTPDQPQPATAVHVQRKAGVGKCAAFDLNAVCSGFVYGLVVTAAMLAADSHESYAGCVASDKFSDLMDRRDARSVPLFGDGAAAAVLGRVPDGYGLLGSSLMADGDYSHLVQVPAGGSLRRASAESVAEGQHLFKMRGREVKEFASVAVPKVVGEALDRASLRADQVDRFVLHQGNVRLVEMLADLVGADRGKVEITGDRFGNVAAASVPLTLSRCHLRNPLRRGETVLLAAVGGGMTAGAAVLRWY